MKVGDRVTIYEDPISENIVEGTGTIVKTDPTDVPPDGLHFVVVEFDDAPGEFYNRLVKDKD